MQDTTIIPLLKGSIDPLGGEDLFIEATREIIKDEIKRHIRETLDRNPEIKHEMQEALRMYYEAKLNQVYANAKLAKAGTRLGIEIMPPEVRDEVIRGFVTLFQKEITEMLEKGL